MNGIKYLLIKADVLKKSRLVIISLGVEYEKNYVVVPTDILVNTK